MSRHLGSELDGALAGPLLEKVGFLNTEQIQIFIDISAATENRSVGGSIPPLGTKASFPSIT